MNDLLDAVLDANPSASSDAISEAISEYVESCIIKALSSLPPVSIPTPAHVQLANLKTKRRRKAHPAQARGITGDEARLFELYQLRRELDGHDKNGTVPAYRANLSDWESIDREFREPAIRDSPNGHLDRKEDASVSRLPRRTSAFHGSVIPEPLEEPTVRGSLEPSIANIVVADPIFEEIVKTVEGVLRAFAVERELPIGFGFRMSRDPEYPKWKRYIVELNANLDFDSKMDFWKEIDASVRQALRRVDQGNPEISQQIVDLSSNLFLHVEL